MIKTNSTILLNTLSLKYEIEGLYHQNKIKKENVSVTDIAKTFVEDKGIDFDSAVSIVKTLNNIVK